ncbi:methyl-CpG-binding domain-containing protein 9 isoform X2 [Rhodamnia argentea]|uniref:Methyl-CpG-binding domain-containing protein 9 isoform X2 n=1 Tax=Rhodamnia argentea TaxID=178133 RepID=A0ABM3GWT9_9MYRT|nr:methyl-CpG-binding domain-containing protein 9 isoform X2 [Rhodamnia argentea]
MEPGDIGRQRQVSEPRPGGGEAARPSHLEIDLNEIPSPTADSDPFDVVRSFQDAPEPPAEPAAEPVVARSPAPCAACGEPEGGGGHVVVCDGCERGFHVACAGVMRGMDVEEWVCRECVGRGVKSRRWPLGFKPNRRRFLDMNASPPSDGDCDGEGSDAVIELRGYLTHAHPKEFISDSQTMELVSSNGKTLKATEAGSEENFGSEFQQSKDGLPVQFEDFFVLHLGLVDLRPSYHELDRILPVGYRSCWHDKITGSIMFCEVLDGGDSGPLFKIRRCSCSVVPIPNGSTILFRRVLRQYAGPDTKATDDVIYSSMDCDDDGIIQAILTNPLPPVENELSACLCSGRNEVSDVTESSMQTDPSTALVHYATSVNHEDCLGDEIGEIVVEERSSSLAWKKLSQKFVDAFSDICSRKSSYKLSCKHVKNETISSYWDMMDEKSVPAPIALQKFSSSPVFAGFPLYNSDSDISTDALLKWLGQDRFGLDAEFVQETIEKLPGIEGCSRYVLLSNRNNYTRSLTIGNGNFIVKRKEGVRIKEGTLDGLFGELRKSTVDGDDRSSPPSGTEPCSRLSPAIAGDCYQVWEVLWRFHDILDLKEPLPLKKLEDELINPWVDVSKVAVNFGQKLQECQVLDLHSSDHRGDETPSGTAPGSQFCGEHLCKFRSVETGAKKESTYAKSPCIEFSTCCGIALTKVHSLLLEVLIGELQLKVAALVDRNFETGELKSRRGRRKDIESSLPAKRAKLSMLPINELTWPELARRYILSIITMDGNSDSADVTSRESGKVFRCLQGDGGVLCGSLTGVAGMEADALLLAEASKQILGSMSKENEFLTLEVEESAGPDAVEKNSAGDGNLPDWAQALVPVKKLPTNVGTRIRKCVHDALAKDPPDWAKKILEHSISKEVYKGNASGPTKKAVLSVLADISGEAPQPKPEKKSKRRTVISVSDVIMKKCRVVLRQAAAADDERVFCNLLGRKIMNSNDKDEEGLLGSPAMVSRPLDFRTIDLRLAVGAYGGSQEAFLEDVRELWNNVRTAFEDQTDVVELADKLSQNFESLYEEKVVTLVDKLRVYAKSESLSADIKKEVDDVLASLSELPKAPWEEGVCKVCGIDRDDDSVLLCDTCDAEYHTYCLNPPLARIPEGNWYCPSCVVGRRLVQDVSGQNYVIRKHRGKRFQEVTRDYLEALSDLVSRMEEKEYWDYTVDERTFLLKFLCDELLNSALVRQHLEQCAEISAELQQKMRMLITEWKNLKVKEDYLVARAATADGATNTCGEVMGKRGLDPAQSNNTRRIVHQPSEKSKNLNSLPELQLVEAGREKCGLNGFDHSSIAMAEKNGLYKDKAGNPTNNNCELVDNGISNGDRKLLGNTLSSRASQTDDSTVKSHDSPKLDLFPEEVNDPERKIFEQESCLCSDSRNFPCSQHLDDLNESTHQVELTSVKNELSALQDSISNVESQLVKLSLRREFLGSDSVGRLYWATAMPGSRPRIVVDGTLASGKRRKILNSVVPERNGTQGSAPTSESSLVGSKACCPFMHKSNGVAAANQSWVFYQTDDEIEQLVGWLKGSDSREKALKDAILNWWKFKLRECQDPVGQISDASEATSEGCSIGENLVTSVCVATKASSFLERKYGRCTEVECTGTLKKRAKKARVPSEERMYRCECLELIWSSRYHCLFCHRTFLTDDELEVHNDGRCSPGSSGHEKGKENADSSKKKGSLKSDSAQIERTGGNDVYDKSRHLDLCSDLITFQNEGFVCPYDIDEISSKFVTKDSNKDLVQQIGLIGSNGIPSLVPSRPSYLDDYDPFLLSSGDASVPPEEYKEVGVTGLREDRSIRNTNTSECYNTRPGSENIGTHRDAKSTLASSEGKERKPIHKRAMATGLGQRCVVPQSSLRPLPGRVFPILRQLKINLLDMDAALEGEYLKPSKAHLEGRWAWRSFVRSSQTIYEMVQATIVLEDMIQTKYLRKEWWYWSSLSAAVKTSTLSSLALRIYSLDSAILYENILPDLDSTDIVVDKTIPSTLDPTDKPKPSRKSSRKRKEPEG